MPRRFVRLPQLSLLRSQPLASQPTGAERAGRPAPRPRWVVLRGPRAYRVATFFLRHRLSDRCIVLSSMRHNVAVPGLALSPGPVATDNPRPPPVEMTWYAVENPRRDAV
ncbi:hypothetical protein CA85_19900 [Allorhodopirellula solitaria]|uniref:Uncharacterized protein n=1 Tax=Allorhodopirellula solitaria TaxID=2527987 RepID=A0A5C5XXN7_9BACT|nr:hypothetical protein CA85_19900 [Allorhodopirellula solitaria]